MLEPVSVLSVQLGLAAVYALSRPGSAVSSEAYAVQACAEQIFERVERSDALFGEKASVISALFSLVQDHGELGWDGEAALPVDRRAVARAVSLVRALPDHCAMPEVGVDPDGAVSLDWIATRNCMLSVAVAGDSERLACAWLDGTDRGHAVLKFDRDAVPVRLLQAIQAVQGA